MFSNKESSVSSQIGLLEIIFQGIDFTSVLCLYFLVSLSYSQAFCPSGWHVYLALVELTTLGICPNKNIYGRVFFLNLASLKKYFVDVVLFIFCLKISKEEWPTTDKQDYQPNLLNIIFIVFIQNTNKRGLYICIAVTW